MDRHAASALRIAQALDEHPAVTRVRYPFLPSHPAYETALRQMRNGGGIVTFELRDGLEGGKRFLNRLTMLSMTNNLGDSRTIASHPASTTHSKLSEAERQAVGITPGLIRISVGLEHPEDILADILQALGRD
jgi:O-succinylhomoserine sulfhydrylase